MRANIRLGCSGWSYDEWVGPVYRSAKESKLAAYSKVFEIAEINSTFYRNPTKGTVFGWRRYTPDDFVFTAKIPQVVTHDKLLDVNKGVEHDLKVYCELMKPLADSGKLRCLLIQLPPRLRFHLDKTRSFFEVLPEDYQYAIEFRNRSWMCDEAYELLKEFNVAYTIVDEPLLPSDIKITSNIAYLRWHGKGKRPWYNYRYEIKELEPWVPKLAEIATKTKEVYGFFNNHYHGYAPENCIQVLEMLGSVTQAQVDAKKRIDEFRAGRITVPSAQPPKPKTATEPESKRTTLADFESEKVDDMSVNELLETFMDLERLRRAKYIKDSELEIAEMTDEEIKAKIRHYYIVLDIANKRISHNCGDWARCIFNKSFCKHLGKLMMSIPESKAKTIMRSIRTERDQWEFGI